MKILYIGAVEFSARMLQKLIDLDAPIVGVVSPTASSINADFFDLSSIAEAHGIPWKHITNVNDADSLNWIRQKNPDIIFCFGFSQLLRTELLAIAPLGVLGYHPASLPMNRGRHPLIWAIALGLTYTASTFFFIDGGIDSGDIVHQVDLPIEYNDDARTLYDKLITVARTQVEEIYYQLQEKKLSRMPQDTACASVWRKRSKQDGKIDFRMHKRAIYNLVRSLRSPYVGAHVFFKGEDVKVWRTAERVVNDVLSSNAEFGKVLSVDGNVVVVKCDGGAIALLEHEFSELPKVGDYIL